MRLGCGILLILWGLFVATPTVMRSRDKDVSDAGRIGEMLFPLAVIVGGSVLAWTGRKTSAASTGDPPSHDRAPGPCEVPHSTHVRRSDDEAIAKPARHRGRWWWLTLGLGVAAVIFACILGKAGLGLMKSKAQGTPTVPGTWARSLTTRHGTATGTVTFSEDGSYTMTETFKVQLTRLYEITVKQSGTWRFANQTLYLTTTESSHPKLSPVGESYTEEMSELTEDEMISRDSENTVTYRRIGK